MSSLPGLNSIFQRHIISVWCSKDGATSDSGWAVRSDKDSIWWNFEGRIKKGAKFYKTVYFVLAFFIHTVLYWQFYIQKNCKLITANNNNREYQFCEENLLWTIFLLPVTMSMFVCVRPVCLLLSFIFLCCCIDKIL